LIGMYRSTIFEFHRFALLESTVFRTGWDTEFICSIDVEATGSVLFVECVSPGVYSVAQGTCTHFEIGMLVDAPTVSYLADSDVEVRPEDVELAEGFEPTLESGRADDIERTVALVQGERPDQAGEPVDVVAVKVRQKNGLERPGAEVRFGEAGLGAFATIEHEEFTLAEEGERGDPPVWHGFSATRSQECEPKRHGDRGAVSGRGNRRDVGT